MATEPLVTAEELADTFAVVGYAPETERDSWTPTDLNDLPEAPPVEPDLGATHLVYPGKRHVFSGPPESAKTLAAYCVLLRVVRQGGTGVLIDFEMGAYDARQRLRELGADRSELSSIAYLEPDEPASVERISRLVNLRPDLVVIDASAGIYSLEGLDDNRRLDVEKIAALYIKLFWRKGIATILIDHVVKNAESRGSFQIGSERKLGSADVHLGFATITPISRGTSGRYKVMNYKDRGGWLKRGHLANLELDSDSDTHEITWTFTTPPIDTGDTGYFRPTHLMEKVSILLENQSEPITRNAIYDALGGTKDYILKAVSALVMEGFVGEGDGPNRSKPVRSLRSYREASAEDNPEEIPGGSVVLCSSAVVREPQWLGGSGGSRTYGTRPPTTATPTTPNEPGWFDENGNFEEVPFDPAWVEAMKPDEED